MFSQTVPALQMPQGANAILGGISQGYQNQANAARVQQMQMQNKLQHFQFVNQLAGSVRYNPTQENWDAAKTAMVNAGFGEDAAKLPANVQDAWPIIQNAYNYSGQLLQYYTAASKIAEANILMNKNASEANRNQFQQGQPQPFNNLGGSPAGLLPQLPSGPMNADGSYMNGNSANNSMMGNMLPNQSIQGGGNQIQQQLQNQPAATVAANEPILPGAQQPSRPFLPPPPTSPSEQAQQTEANKNWAAFKNGFANNDANYLATKTAINNIKSVYDQGFNKFSGPTPFVGSALGLTDKGQFLNNQGHVLNLNYIQSLADHLSRMDIPIVKAVQTLSPNTSTALMSNKAEVARSEFLNESGNAMNQLMPTLDQMGLRDTNKAQQILTDAISKTNYLNKDRTVNIAGFSRWEQNLPQQIKDRYFFNKYASQGIPIYRDQNGDYVTGDKIMGLSKHYNIPPEQVIQNNKMKLIMPSAQQSPYTVNQNQISALQNSPPQVKSALGIG